jgi:hypothetical protein
MPNFPLFDQEYTDWYRAWSSLGDICDPSKPCERHEILYTNGRPLRQYLSKIELMQGSCKIVMKFPMGGNCGGLLYKAGDKKEHEEFSLKKWKDKRGWRLILPQRVEQLKEWFPMIMKTMFTSETPTSAAIRYTSVCQQLELVVKTATSSYEIVFTNDLNPVPEFPSEWFNGRPLTE